MNRFLNPFKECITEIKTNRDLSKQHHSKYNKSKIMSLVYFNILFLIIYSILWLVLIWCIFGGIFLTPAGFVAALITPIPGIIAALLIQKKVYPKTKTNLMKSLKEN